MDQLFVAELVFGVTAVMLLVSLVDQYLKRRLTLSLTMFLGVCMLALTVLWGPWEVVIAGAIFLALIVYCAWDIRHPHKHSRKTVAS